MSKHKKKKKSVAVATSRKYLYVSSCHDAQAIKPVLTALPEYRSASISDFGGLGKWRCTVCKRRCTVKRQKLEAAA